MATKQPRRMIGEPGDFMVISLFGRTFLEREIKRDLAEKVRILDRCEQLIQKALKTSPPWNELAFPAFNGCEERSGVRRGRDPIRVLIGRRAPGNEDGAQEEAVTVISEAERNGTKSTSIQICFNRFPEFNPNPLLSAWPLEEGVAQAQVRHIWLRSLGQWNIESEYQRALIEHFQSKYPALNKEVRSFTVGDRVVGSNPVFDRGTMRKVQWNSAPDLLISVTGSSCVTITRKPEKPKLTIQ